MAKPNMVGNIPGKMLGLYADLSHKLKDGVITERELELFLQRQNPFAINSTLDQWHEFYRKYFRLALDFSKVSVPKEQDEFSRVLFIPAGLTLHTIIKAMQKCFSVNTNNEHLDEHVDRNDRDNRFTYAIRVRDRVEADQELKGLSADHLQSQKIKTLTLIERLVYELKYYSETNEHLDVESTTLCAGSRDRYGHVPHVRWRLGLGGLLVYACKAKDTDHELSARQVVS